MKKYVLLLSIAGTTLAACTNHSHNHEPAATAKQGDSLAVVREVPSSPHEETQSGSHHHEEGAVVQLQNGSKWKANPETITGIHNMQKLIEEGISGKTAPEQLHRPLLSEFNTIFEKCTMKGEAHQQLHNYLLPFKEYLHQMEQGETSPEHLRKMQAYLLAFPHFFE